MLFNSYIFILVFLPVTLAGYYTINRFSLKAGEAWLLAMSLWFYGYFNPWYLLLIGASICCNYAFSRMLNRKDRAGRKALLAVAVSCNVLLIFYFKYYDFFIENINALFHANHALKHILLPLGISFFTLQQISFVVDSYYGKTSDYGFLEYALFVSFFPQLVAGPIVLHDELIPQFRDAEKKIFRSENFAPGVIQFTLGLSKKILIADWLGRAVDCVYGWGEKAVSLEVLIGIVAYCMQIYFDFSGYSDMAVGLGKMCNFTLPVNFDSPYRALSMPEFWQRWHMTLGRFLRKYIYIPLGGNRCGTARTILNTMITFGISGLWHGANYTFVLWGLFHGAGVCAGRLFAPLQEKLPRVCRWILTWGYVTLLFGLFRAESVTQYAGMLKNLFAFSASGPRRALLETMEIPYLRASLEKLSIAGGEAAGFPISGMVMFALPFLICLLMQNNYRRTYRYGAASLIGTVTLLMLCIVSMSRVSAFLYFNF